MSNGIERPFGIEVTNTMTAVDENLEEGLLKNGLPGTLITEKEDSMSKGDSDIRNGSEKIFDNSVVKEILTRTHHSRSTIDDLVEDIEDFLDDNLLPSEVVLHRGNEVTVKNKEKRGGLVLYNLENGSKINSHDLKRKLSIDTAKIRSCINKFANFDGKTWQVDDEAKTKFGIKDKLAPIFFSPKVNKSALAETKSGSSSEEEDKAEAERQRRISGLPPTANRKSIQAKENKEREKKQKAEAKKEKKEKKEKEKTEKEGSKKKKEQKLDKWTKKGTEGKKTEDSAVFMTPTKRSERYVEQATKKLQAAWTAKNSKEFQDAAKWAGEHLALKHIEEFSNSVWIFAVKKYYNKLKDSRVLAKMSSKDEKKEYKETMAEEREEYYKKYGLLLKNYFSTSVMEEDLELCQTTLELPGEEIEMREGLLDCYEITQFVSSYASYLNADFEVTAAELLDATTSGLEGFQKTTFKILDVLVGNFVHENMELRYMNIRLREFTSTTFTISEKLRSYLNNGQKMNNLPKLPLQPESSATTEAQQQQDVDKNIEDEDVKETLEDTEIDREKEERVRFCLMLGNREFYELESREQIEFLLYLTRTIVDLDSARDFIASDNAESINKLKQSIEKTVEQLKELEKNLAEVRQYTEKERESSMSRTESRKMAENDKKREQLQRKIVDTTEKREDLKEQLFMAKARMMRVPLIGMDRHFRRYYWFVSSTDSAIYVQDFGRSAYEKYVIEVAEAGQLLADSTILYPPTEEAKTEKWYKLVEVKGIEKLRSQLLKNGERESDLKTYLDKYLDLIYNFNARRHRKNTRSASPQLEENEGKENRFKGKFAALKSDLLSLLHDLKNIYATSISDTELFETRISDAESLEDLKQLLHELAGSIRRSLIIEKLPMKLAQETGWYSHMIMPSFLQRILMASTLSGLHSLLAYLDSRINWDEQLDEKRCRICHSRRRPDDKVQCGVCDFVCHYTCVKKKSKPDVYFCATCEREEKKKRLKQLLEAKESTEEETENDEQVEDEDQEETAEGEEVEDEDEENEDEDDGSENEDDESMEGGSDEDSKPKKDIRKRKVDSNVDANAAKKAKEDKAEMKEFKKIGILFEAIRNTDVRLFPIIEGISVPHGRKNRNAITLQKIEDKMFDYSSVEQLKDDLILFFTGVRDWFNVNKPRRLDDLEDYLEKVGLSLD